MATQRWLSSTGGWCLRQIIWEFFQSFYKSSNLARLVAKFALKMQACALPRAVQAGKLHWQVNWTKSVLADGNRNTRLLKRIKKALKQALSQFWLHFGEHLRATRPVVWVKSSLSARAWEFWHDVHNTSWYNNHTHDSTRLHWQIQQRSHWQMIDTWISN